MFSPYYPDYYCRPNNYCGGQGGFFGRPPFASPCRRTPNLFIIIFLLLRLLKNGDTLIGDNNNVLLIIIVIFVFLSCAGADDGREGIGF